MGALPAATQQKEIAQVGTIIAEAMDKVGKEAVITIEEAT